MNPVDAIEEIWLSYQMMLVLPDFVVMPLEPEVLRCHPEYDSQSQFLLKYVWRPSGIPPTLLIQIIRILS